MNWSDEYRLARRCLFGGKDQPQDLEQAFTLFQQEAQKGNALAMHDLGRMLADGLGRKIDMQAAHVWYSKALAAFYAVERQKKKRYADYIIENDTTEAELHLRVDELIGTLQKNAAENNAQPSCEA